MIILRVPNDVFNHSERMLSPDELLVLLFFLRNRNLENESFVSVNLLNEFFKFQKGNDRKNRPYLKNILISLENKKYIEFNTDEIINDNSLIVIDVLDKRVGYIGVSSDIFDDLVGNEDIHKAKLKIFLYAFIHCYGTVGRKVDYKQLSELCRYFQGKKKYSVTTIQKIIGEMDGKYIYRFSGAFQDLESKREVNTYYTVLKGNKENEYSRRLKDKNKNRKRKSEEMVFTVSCGEISVSELSRLADEETNWQKLNDDGSYKDITMFDYEIYRVCEDENVNVKFIRRCRKGIQVMKENPEKYPYDWDSMEKTYLRDKEMANTE